MRTTGPQGKPRVSKTPLIRALSAGICGLSFLGFWSLQVSRSLSGDFWRLVSGSQNSVPGGWVLSPLRVRFSSSRIGVNLSVRIGQAVTMPSGIRSVQRHGFPDLFATHRLVQHEAFERIELAPPGRAFQHPHRMRVTRFPTLSDS